MTTPMPSLRRLHVRWWPLVRLTEMQAPERRWKLGEQQVKGRKRLVLASPRGRKWIMMMGIKKQRGTWIEEINT